MQITIEVPDFTNAVTYQYVYFDIETRQNMLGQGSFDSKGLEQFRRQNE